MKQEYKNHFIKPEFYDMGNFFVVKLPNINYKSKIDQINDEINDEINDQIKSSDQVNEEINDQIKLSDQINDEIKLSDQITILRKAILLIIKKHPGIKVNEILEQLVCMNIYTSITTIQNQLRRKLSKYVVYIGSRKTGGYYYKKDVN